MDNTTVSPTSTPSQNRAAQIMGDRNFFGVRQVTELLGIRPSPDQLEALRMVPYNQSTLRDCKETHVLIPDLGLSIEDMRRQVAPAAFQPCVRNWLFASFEVFATDRRDTGWRLLCKNPMILSEAIPEHSMNPPPLDDEIANSGFLVYVMTLWRCLMSQSFWPDLIFLSSDSLEGEGPIVVGDVDQHQVNGGPVITGRGLLFGPSRVLHPILRIAYLKKPNRKGSN